MVAVRVRNLYASLLAMGIIVAFGGASFHQSWCLYWFAAGDWCYAAAYQLWRDFSGGFPGDDWNSYEYIPLCRPVKPWVSPVSLLGYLVEKVWLDSTGSSVCLAIFALD